MEIERLYEQQIELYRQLIKEMKNNHEQNTSAYPQRIIREHGYANLNPKRRTTHAITATTVRKD